MSKKFLITGASGLLGGCFVQRLQKLDYKILTLERSDLVFNVKKAQLFQKIKNNDCDILIHCAANTNVEQCELNKDECYSVNLLLTETLARICYKLQIKLVFISSTGVYGDYKNEPYKEYDKVKPTTVHHDSKYQAENAINMLCKEALIIRTGWLFGGAPTLKKNFVAKRIKEATNSPGFIYSNPHQTGNPTYVNDVVDQVISLIKDDQVGIFNCVNEGTASRFDYIKEIIELYKIGTEVRKVQGNFKRVAQVSNNECAINYKMNILGYPKMRHWKLALKEYIETTLLSN